MMDSAKLREYAELLGSEIIKNKGKSKDIDFLEAYQPLRSALEDAKAGRIFEPRDLGGLMRWQQESDIQNFDKLAERLAQFEILLWGWKLPSEGGP